MVSHLSGTFGMSALTIAGHAALAGGFAVGAAIIACRRPRTFAPRMLTLVFCLYFFHIVPPSFLMDARAARRLKNILSGVVRKRAGFQQRFHPHQIGVHIRLWVSAECFCHSMSDGTSRRIVTEPDGDLCRAVVIRLKENI